MRLRTQLLLLITLLLVSAVLLLEHLVSRSIEPEFERYGLETVSLISARERDKIEKLLDVTEKQIRSLARLVSPITGEIREPGSSLLREQLFDRFLIFSEVNGAWTALGPTGFRSQGALPDLPRELTDLSSPGTYRLFQRGPDRWYFWIRQGARIFFVSFPLATIQTFQDLSGLAKGYVWTKQSGIFEAEYDVLAVPEERKFWSDWVQKNSQQEKTQMMTAGGESLYVAHLPSSTYQFSVMATWPRAEVQAPWLTLKKRVRAIAGVVIALAGLLAIWLLARAMRPLEDLEAATERVAGGDFNVTFQSQRKDEVGHLMRSFEVMGAKIRELIDRTALSARLEVEIKAARLVQEMYSASNDVDLGKIQVCGRTMTASECGGDLWAAWQTEDFGYVVIADATGHGVPAALLTSALRAVVSVLEKSGSNDLGGMIDLTRKAIEDVGRGKTCITMFLVQIEKRSGFVRTYNAGHQEAYVLPAHIGENLKWKQLGVLFEPTNASFGLRTDQPNEFGTYQMEPGQTILLLTDGIADLKDEQNEPWKDRDFLGEVIESFKEAALQDLVACFANLWGRVHRRRGENDLVDDVSLVMIRWPSKPSRN